MRNAPIVAGVPTPYVMHKHVYPSRFHGPIYTRPVFGFPQIARPEDVFTPGYNISRGTPQPPISGLGETEGQEMWNVGDGVFKPGGYGGGVFDGNISGLGSLGARTQKLRRRPLRVGPSGTLLGLGDDAADYPWKAYSDKTKVLQQQTNISLQKAGLCPLTTDGKLGPATCGARDYLTNHSQELLGQSMDFGNPSTCDGQTVTLPKPASSGCGAGGGSPVISSKTPVPALPVVQSGMSSSTKRALGFGLGAVLAVGAVVLLRKKHG